MAEYILSNGYTLDLPEGTSPEEAVEYATYLGNADESVSVANMGGQEIAPQQVPQQAPQQAPEAQGETPGYFEGILTNVAQGATLDFADEAMAGAASMFDPEQTYAEIRDKLRSRNKRFTEESPWIAGGAKLVGGMLPITKMMQGAKLLKSAAMGAGASIADYVGQADEIEDINLPDAAIAGTVGAAIPSVFTGIGGAARFAKRLIGGGKDKAVTSTLQSIVRESGLSKDEVVNVLKNAKKSDSLADLFPYIVPQMARDVRIKGGKELSDKMAKDLSKPGARGRVIDALPENKGYHKTMDDMVKTREAEAKDLYGKFNKSVTTPTTSLIGSINGHPRIKSAYNNLVQEAADGPKVSQLPSLEELNAGAGISGQVLQKLKWDVDGIIRALKRSSDPKDSLELSRLMPLRNQLLEAIEETAPGFKKANSAFAGRRAMEEAMEQGKKDGIGKLNLEDQLEQMANYSKSEQDTYAKGLLSNINSGIGKGKEDSITFLNRLESPNAKEVMGEAFGPDTTKKLSGAIDTERGYKAIEKEVMKGQGFTDIAKSMETSIGHPYNMAKSIISKHAKEALGNRIPSKDLDTIAKLMVSPDGVEDATRIMMKYFKPAEVSKLMSNMNAAGVAATLPTYDTSAKQPDLMEELR